MNTPISWIKAYVPDLDCTVQEYVDKMTLSGSHVENAVYLDKNLEKIVVGRIEKIEKHPDADKLEKIRNSRIPIGNTIFHCRCIICLCRNTILIFFYSTIQCA